MHGSFCLFLFQFFAAVKIHVMDETKVFTNEACVVSDTEDILNITEKGVNCR